MSAIWFGQIETQQNGRFFDREGAQYKHSYKHLFWVILRNNLVCHLVWRSDWPVPEVYRLNQFTSSDSDR